MTTCRVVLTDVPGLGTGDHLTEPWGMTVMGVVADPYRETVDTIVEWQAADPVPGRWTWRRGQAPVRYRTLADLAADAVPLGG